MNGPILAALRGAAGKDTSEVTSTRKGQGKKCRNNEQQRCSADTTVCRAQVQVLCRGNAQCVADSISCCDACSADGLLTCLFAGVNGASRNAVVGFR
jgi:hypothetical protein